MNNYIDIKSLNNEELAGVVNIYPWFGSARKELCLRMIGMGDGGGRCAEAAMYIGSPRIIADAMRNSKAVDWTDNELGRMLKEASAPDKKVRVAGGDFFSQAEYDKVRKSSDTIFSHMATATHHDREKGDGNVPDTSFCTETLAQIYIEQGYYEQAMFIYRQLLLRYPEKNAYFASLIQKLELIDNQTDRI